MLSFCISNMPIPLQLPTFFKPCPLPLLSNQKTKHQLIQKEIDLPSFFKKGSLKEKKKSLSNCKKKNVIEYRPTAPGLLSLPNEQIVITYLCLQSTLRFSSIRFLCPYILLLFTYTRSLLVHSTSIRPYYVRCFYLTTFPLANISTMFSATTFVYLRWSPCVR